MARSVFFSFHYQRDVWRVNQIRNLPEVIGTGAAGFKDASLWEEAKRKGDAVVQDMIDRALKGTSVTVVFIGQETAGRKFINYEIDKSIERGNGLVGILIIAPYNAQLFELQERIPDGRIGTVDKFQGQEAPIVIYSMTTSSHSDAPRGMEFLYSANRLADLCHNV